MQIRPRDIAALYGANASSLKKIYDKIPPVTCSGRAACCTLLPEMTALEAASALSSIGEFKARERSGILARVAEYFLLNAVKIMSCPFLKNGRCLIYAERFLGCRTYGLWSPAHYSRMAEAGVRAKEGVKRAWASAGITIPEEIVNFSVPYCNRVRVKKGKRRPSDKALQRLGQQVHDLSASLMGPMHSDFAHAFYMDLSFYICSLAVGMKQAAQLKFNAVARYCAGEQNVHDEIRALTARLEMLFSA